MQEPCPVTCQNLRLVIRAGPVAFQHCLSAVPFSNGFCLSAGRLSAYLRVEGTEGLIEKKQLGIASEGSGQSHPLPLPPRQLGGLVVSIPRHLYHLQQRFHPAQYGTLYVFLHLLVNDRNNTWCLYGCATTYYTLHV